MYSTAVAQAALRGRHIEFVGDSTTYELMCAVAWLILGQGRRVHDHTSCPRHRNKVLKNRRFDSHGGWVRWSDGLPDLAGSCPAPPRRPVCLSDSLSLAGALGVGVADMYPLRLSFVWVGSADICYSSEGIGSVLDSEVGLGLG